MTDTGQGEGGAGRGDRTERDRCKGDRQTEGGRVTTTTEAHLKLREDHGWR